MDRFTSIWIKGKCFPAGSLLSLFPEKARYARLFGRNGSGKSTISSSVRAASLKAPDSDIEVSFMDDSENACANGKDLLDSTYVFNEDYVEQYVRIKTTGLDAILLLGEAGEFSSQIEQCKKEEGQIASDLEVCKLQEEALSSSTGDRSVSKARSLLLDALKGKGGACWAGRDKRIKRGKKNSAVNDQRLAAIQERPMPEKDITELTAEFETKLEEYLLLSDDSSHSIEPYSGVEGQIADSTSIELVKELLLEKVDEPILTGRDKRILEIVGMFGNSFVENAMSHLGSDELGYCPYCFRDIDSETVNEIAVNVSNVLDKRVEDHQNALQGALFAKLEFDLSDYDEFFAEHCLKLTELRESYNSEIEKANNLLEQKGQNVFAPIVFDPQKLTDLRNKIDNASEALTKAVEAYNTELGKLSSRRSELDVLNSQIARIEIAPYEEKWNALVAEQATVKQNLEAKSTELIDKRATISELEAKKQNIHVGLDLINKSLAYIFMDSEHLRLEGDSGEYRILSHGNPIPPSSVSSGERNAIGLCYFFACIGQGHAEKDRFSNPVFLLIDDPISSFDYENKIGIITFLRKQFGRALSDNEKSKILVMTHDYQTMQNLGKIYSSDICPSYNEQNAASGKKLPNEKAFVLDGNGLSSWDRKTLDYTTMLNDIFDYALSPKPDLRPFIGNMTRKVLESFSTFEYQRGLNAYSSSPNVLNKIDADLRDYFEGYMSRLILHDESHLEEAVHGESSLTTFNHYSERELERAIRDAVVLIYCLNDEHVVSHLANPDAKTTIERWIQDIRHLANADRSEASRFML